MGSRGSEGAGQVMMINNNRECCMCGDLGFSDQLFQCKLCHFRSQHRYCSNIYPKSESLGTCNWCLDSKDKSTNSSNSNSNSNSNSSSSRKISDGGSDDESSKNKRSSIRKGLINRGISGGGLHLQKLPIKKQKSPQAAGAARSPPLSPSVVTSTLRKRIVTNGALEERLRRTKSEDIAKTSGGGGGARQVVFRNKVRRYKLLEEVSS